MYIYIYMYIYMYNIFQLGRLVAVMTIIIKTQVRTPGHVSVGDRSQGAVEQQFV